MVSRIDDSICSTDATLTDTTIGVDQGVDLDSRTGASPLDAL